MICGCEKTSGLNSLAGGGLSRTAERRSGTCICMDICKEEKPNEPPEPRATAREQPESSPEEPAVKEEPLQQQL